MGKCTLSNAGLFHLGGSVTSFNKSKKQERKTLNITSWTRTRAFSVGASEIQLNPSLSHTVCVQSVTVQ